MTRVALVEKERLDWTGFKKKISLWKRRVAGEDARDSDGRKYLSFKKILDQEQQFFLRDK